MLETTRTYVAKITNSQQVRADLDACGVAASKLWNVGRYYIQDRWDEDSEMPDEKELKSELKQGECTRLPVRNECSDLCGRNRVTNRRVMKPTYCGAVYTRRQGRIFHRHRRFYYIIYHNSL